MYDSSLYFLIAGEASGDVLGAGLMRALKKLTNGKARFVGVGGKRMLAEGLDLFFEQDELAHMGLVEIVRHLPRILKRIRQTVDEVKRRKPAALITIDSPDFCFRVAKKLKGQGIPLIHYVAPSVWAWRPGRARKVAQFLDHLLALLPFEPPYFTREGLACTFVGHPLVESDAGKGDGERFRKHLNLAPDVPLLAVLPGSRKGEVTKLLPVFRATVEKLKEKHPKLQVVVPTVPNVEKIVRQETNQWPVPVITTMDDKTKYDAFAAATAALACSGTVSVELAMAHLPTVIAYKASPLTAAIVRRVVKTKFATLINIMQNRAVMPEFLQENCTPEKLAAAVHGLLTNPTARQQQINELDAVAEWLGRDQFVPSERAARVVLGVRDSGFGTRGGKIPNLKPRNPRTILQIIPNMGAGGAEQSCAEIVEGLVKRGDRALVVSAGGSRVKEIEKLGGKHILKNVNSKNPFVIIRNAAWLAKLIRDEHVDIVHARSRAPAWSAWLACRKTGVPFVTTFHAAYKFSGAAKKFYNRVMTRGIRVIAISRFIRNHIVSAYGIDPKKIRVIYRCVDLKRFVPSAVTESRHAALRQAWGLVEGQRVILMPARLSPIKGHRLFIEAMATVARASTPALHAVGVIVGDDQGRKEYRRELQELIRVKGLGGNVKLVQHCADMPAAYSLADVVVVPSLVPEGFGRVPVEAMAMGVPVIASALGATVETVREGETGWLLPPTDPKAWAKAIARALTLSPEDRERFAQAAMQLARERFSRTEMMDATMKVYDEIMSRALR